MKKVSCSPLPAFFVPRPQALPHRAFVRGAARALLLAVAVCSLAFTPVAFGGGPVTATGGDGGDGNGVGADGAPGSPANHTTYGVYSYITVTGGNGGGGSADGAGGDGGEATVMVSGTVDMDGDLTVTAGSPGTAGVDPSGAGGAATFSVDTLQLSGTSQTLQFTRPASGGAVSVNIGTLDLATGSSGLVNTATLGSLANIISGNIFFGTLKFNGYSGFDGSAALNAAYGLDNFHISGVGNELSLDTTHALGSGSVITVDLNAVGDLDTIMSAAASSGPPAGLDITALTKDNLRFTHSGFTSGYINDIPDINYIIIDGSASTGGDFATGQLNVYTFRRGLAVIELEAIDGTGLGLEGRLGLSPMTRSGEAFKPYVEGHLGGLISLTESSRLVSEGLVRDAAGAAGTGQWAMGMSVSGSHVKVDTGSSVESDNLNLAVSLARKADTTLFGADSALTFGAFFETGRGNYDSYNKFSNGSTANGDGDTEYHGGGIFLRNDFACGLYAEGSLRAGVVDNEYSVDGISGASYDASASYWGAHLGLGSLFAVSDSGTIDLYGKLFWTEVASDSFYDGSGMKVKLDDAASLRSRLGSRYTHAFNEGVVKGYVGAAWEHEFDGEAGGSVGGIKIQENPETRGSSAFGEIGLAIQPAGAPYAIELGAFGTAGKQDSFGGSLQLKYTF